MAEDLNAKAQQLSGKLIAAATDAGRLQYNLELTHASGDQDQNWAAAQSYRNMMKVGYETFNALVDTCAAAIEANTKAQLTEQSQTERTAPTEPV